MSNSIRRLPDAELAVMQALWSCSHPASRGDMEAILQETHPMAQTTLLTLLTRLGEKGFVFIDRVGRSARYTPLISREDYLASQSRRFLDQFCGGSIPAFASALCSSGLTREELEELRRLLEEGSL